MTTKTALIRLADEFSRDAAAAKARLRDAPIRQTDALPERAAAYSDCWLQADVPVVVEGDCPRCESRIDAATDPAPGDEPASWFGGVEYP